MESNFSHVLNGFNQDFIEYSSERVGKKSMEISKEKKKINHRKIQSTLNINFLKKHSFVMPGKLDLSDEIHKNEDYEDFNCQNDKISEVEPRSVESQNASKEMNDKINNEIDEHTPLNGQNEQAKLLIKLLSKKTSFQIPTITAPVEIRRHTNPQTSFKFTNKMKEFINKMKEDTPKNHNESQNLNPMKSLSIKKHHSHNRNLAAQQQKLNMISPCLRKKGVESLIKQRSQQQSSNYNQSLIDINNLSSMLGKNTNTNFSNMIKLITQNKSNDSFQNSQNHNKSFMQSNNSSCFKQSYKQIKEQKLDKIKLYHNNQALHYIKKKQMNVKQKFFYWVKEEKLQELIDLHNQYPTFNLESYDDNGWTLLTLACKTGNLDILNYLIRQNCNINKPNMKGNTALHIAILMQSDEIVDRLINLGANENIRNSDGKTAWNLAVINVNQ